MDILNLLHPKLVHFPIALFVTAFIFECVSFLAQKKDLHKAAVMVYMAAAFFSVLGVLSGLWEADRLHMQHPILTLHRNLAFIVLGQSIFSVTAFLILRKRFPKTARCLFACACFLSAACVFAVGLYGGQMVYEYGVGVKG